MTCIAKVETGAAQGGSTIPGLLSLLVIWIVWGSNPVIAVSLGWLLLDESVTGWTVLATALILTGVAGVFLSRARPERSAPRS